MVHAEHICKLPILLSSGLEIHFLKKIQAEFQMTPDYSDLRKKNTIKYFQVYNKIMYQ